MPGAANAAEEPAGKKRRTRWGQAPAQGGDGSGGGASGSSRQEMEARAEAARNAAMKATSGGASAAAQQQLLVMQRLQLHNQQQRQRSVTSVLESLKTRLSFHGDGGLPHIKAPTRFDSLGRPLDEEGNVIPMVRPKYATLKINRNLEKEDKSIKAAKLPKVNLRQYTDPSQNEWFDPTLKTSGNKLKRQALRFVESGFYARRGGKDLAAKDELSLNTVMGRLAVPLQRKREDAFPELEWWDEPLVEKVPAKELTSGQAARKLKRPTGWSIERQTYGSQNIVNVLLDGQEEFLPYKIKESSIGHLIEHPVPVEPIAEKNPASIPTTMYLTKDEKKKMRRRNRKEKELEKQDKLRMGLIPPDPPKTKLSNLMRVLGRENVANPTGTEAKVRKQVKQRLEGHQERNKAKKLSAEHRAEKHKAKWLEKEETSDQICVCVYSVKELSRKNSVKLFLNARQLQFTGALVSIPNIGNLVIVEGGPRAIRKFKALMLRRIQWTEGDTVGQEGNSDDEELDDVTLTLSKDDICKLLWDGTVKERCFKGWRVHNCFTDADAMRVLSEARAVHYWDIFQRHRDKKADILS